MAAIPYTDLSPAVLPYLMADPSAPLLESVARAVVIDFCKRSWIWKYFADVQDLEADRSTYDLEADSNSDVVAVTNCTVDGVPLVNRSITQLDDELPGWQTETGTPKYFTQIDTDQLILAPVPDTSVTDGIVITLALQPSQTSDGFPKWIHAKYSEEIADGIIGKLMLMPNKGWTDQKTGADHRKRFEQAIADARGSAVQGLSRAATRTTSQH